MSSNFEYNADVAVRYDAAVPIEPEEIGFYLELAREAEAQGLRTLEVTCGTGRLAIPMTREGVRVVGLDSSPAMLARAAEKSAGLDNVTWVEGDMRTFELNEEFGFVYIPAGSFQFLLTTDDQMACLRRICGHLADGGRLALDLDNLGPVIVAEWLGPRRGTFQRNPLRDYVHPETGQQVLSWGSGEFHPSAQRRITVGMTEELDDQGQVVRRAYGQPMELRYLHRFETEHLLARCGFEVESLYGGLDKSDFTGSSLRMIWVARRGK